MAHQDWMQSRQDYIIAIKKTKKIRVAREIAQGCGYAQSFAELWREAFQVGDTSMARVGFRRVVLLWRRGGRCGDGDTAGTGNGVKVCAIRQFAHLDEALVKHFLDMSLLRDEYWTKTLRMRLDGGQEPWMMLID